MAEKEYIERGAALCAVTDNRIVITDDIISLILAVAQKNIRKIPAADVVEVVRCGQCKHWKNSPFNDYGGYCRYCDSAKIDHFCSYGERRTPC